MASFLIVRLGALGDIVHGLPVVAALRTAYPTSRLDWLVDVRHQRILALVPELTARVVVDTRRVAGPTGVAKIVRTLRHARYDVAIDLQGLIKSALLARLSGAARVVGFARAHLRERLATRFYTESIDPGESRHVVDKALALVRAIGVDAASRRFPLAVPGSSVPAEVRVALGIAGDAPFIALNPGAAWPNKRWPAERFGALASALRARTGLRSAVLWGPGEEALAQAVTAASAGAAIVAPRTTLEDAVALLASARLVVSGDTGPFHLAAALGIPVVGLYGPTDPARNGPWAPDDISVSRSPQCLCSHLRRCRADDWCLLDIGVDEVTEQAVRRLSSSARPGSKGDAAVPVQPEHEAR
jgi:heptosyltransferase I